jgi:membrane associated rhomboid family serine protease
MIPLRDTIPSKTVPIVNYGIIGLNILIYIVQYFIVNDPLQFDLYYGLVPARFSNPTMAAYFSFGHQVFSFVSYMFLHGGFLHLIGNLWFLYIFGDNVEDNLGPVKYLFFYLLCGITAGFFHMIFNFSSPLPVIGASGAIAGVMGAYFILYPSARILTLFPIFIIPFFFEIPAFVFLGLWFMLQFFNAALTPSYVSGVAWWAHVGGFVVGIFLLKIFGKMPEMGISRFTRQITERKTSYRLQVIQPSGPPSDPNLYGILTITEYEAINGAAKVINIPWGFYSQLFRVWIPPNTREGNIIRLRGLGKRTPDGTRGDVLLTVTVETPVYEIVNPM